MHEILNYRSAGDLAELDDRELQRSPVPEAERAGRDSWVALQRLRRQHELAAA
jgi:hypothetical protein